MRGDSTSNDYSAPMKGFAAQDVCSEKAPVEEQTIVAPLSQPTIAEATGWSLGGIIKAGVIYGTCLPWIVALLLLATGLPSGRITSQDIAQSIPFLLMLSFWVGLIGVTLSAIGGMLSICLVIGVNRTLGHAWSPITAGSLAGGATGYLSAALITASMIEFPFEKFSMTTIIVSFLLGPVLAMLMGQYFASKSVIRNLQMTYEKCKSKTPTLCQEESIGSLRQFSIKQLLIITIWFGGIFAIAPFIYRGSPGYAVCLGLYCIAQPFGAIAMNAFMSKSIAKQLASLTELKLDELR